MPYPISVNKNNYIENRKKSDIETPIWLSKQIHKIITEAGVPYSRVFDICSGDGCLSCYFDNVTAVDRQFSDTIIGSKIRRIQIDFLENRAFKAIDPGFNDLILINPPFNDETGQYKRKMLPELFLEKIFYLWGERARVVMFVPMGFRLNQRKTSRRWKWLSGLNSEITSILSLPIDTFKDVLFHAEVLFFNMPMLKPHYWIDYPKNGGKYDTQ